MQQSASNSLQLYRQIREEFIRLFRPWGGFRSVMWPNQEEKNRFLCNNFYRLVHKIREELQTQKQSQLCYRLYQTLVRNQNVACFWKYVIQEVICPDSVYTETIIMYFLNEEYVLSGQDAEKLKQMIEQLIREDHAEPEPGAQESKTESEAPIDSETQPKDAVDQAVMKESLRKDMLREVAAEKKAVLQEVEAMREAALREVAAEKKAALQEVEAMREAALREVQDAKAARLQMLEHDCIYQERQKADAAYREIVQREIDGREAFEDELCRSLHEVSREFNSGSKAAIASLEQDMMEMMEAFHRSVQAVLSGIEESTEKTKAQLSMGSQKAINEVVNTERRIRRNDFMDLLQNFRELQEILFYNQKAENVEAYNDKLIFYNREQHQIVLDCFNLSSFADRLLRVINGLGFEELVPEVDTPYDPVRHVACTRNFDDRLPTDLRDYAVEAVIAYGFYQADDIILPAEVIVRKKM